MVSVSGEIDALRGTANSGDHSPLHEEIRGFKLCYSVLCFYVLENRQLVKLVYLAHDSESKEGQGHGSATSPLLCILAWLRASRMETD